MTLPPHGPPEITEAQQAATSLGEIEDPTPDNVSRALQDYSPYAVAAAAAALGAGGGGAGGSGPQTGADSPVGAVTPTAVGGLYVDTTHGALYVAHGATSADWTALGGVAGTNGFGEVIGLIGRDGTLMLLGGVDPDTPLFGAGPMLSDAYAQWNGGGAGLSIVGTGTDGQQELTWTNGAGLWKICNRNGSIDGPPGGIIFPSSDPEIVGAWWDDSGVLTRSSG